MKNSIKEHYRYIKNRVQQFGLTTTVKDDSGGEHYFYRGHEYIEIGGIKWAVTNVGANTEIDSGLYFAFGEAQGYTAKQVFKGERKFNRDKYTNVEFDSVNVYWGGKWRLPTDDEFQSLLYSTTHEWVEDYEGSGVSGRLFTDKTDSSKKLFFPAVGFCYHDNMYSVGLSGLYWTSSLDTNAKYLHFDNWRPYILKDLRRFVGLSIRGVVGD